MTSRLKSAEITGSCAQVWNGVIIPSNGVISVKIDGNNLSATIKSGLEKKDSRTRIQNIDSVEIHTAPIYLLLAIGIGLSVIGLIGWISTFSNGNSPMLAFVLLLAGIAAIVLSILNKQRYMAIYSLRYTIVLFMKGSPELYQQFAARVMAVADSLNHAEISQS
ncbi:MAG: hypothetical protein ACK5EU_17615 [Pseudanabaena sp.]|jgi:F0F1-type ATP synthase assembly protein I|uniref:hypothetical protein n=1 Tax=Pseudanabaena mucicola TaxID=71190 RepID=UPI002574F839|nr:hypothetical protein [Pseudanabaena mucicola]MCA6553994.1 hypothetical protein [Pseudanabaena sp. M135S2SP2A07QC]MCA6560078.1 hypothetical protein [Pseudanabaena sp. M079S1SP2A07QC]MCA6574799.1 hypothetical protein [Pseudanabaena sp. M53BS1SP1A06MG]MCA6582754.1 hypothetical protein [Pseudanabaena sp. M34BS1SP1A06MG]MCA6586199.1 hypothetical protein [Pseudanabaena sp. M051S1SP1A06QC]MCA6588678.1 hypothetical protein [Pseudanabaena sp. M109S1SP1A06QC]MCA6591084.1 hypothetical protein [Pseud